MTAYDEARVAGLAALHADQDWHKPDGGGVWRANYGRAVDLVLEAALPHLTDDGAAAPGGAPGNASAFGLSTGATPTAAPSSPHRKHVEAVLRDRLVRSNFNDNLHEPLRTQSIDTWVDVLAGSLFAAALFGEGATPAIDRRTLERLIENAEHYDTCSSVLSPDAGYDCSCLLADLRALIGGTS